MYIQAIGGGGQGWANAILYIFLSPTIRYRLFHCYGSRIDTKQLQEVSASSTQSYHPQVTSNTLSTDSVRNLI